MCSPSSQTCLKGSPDHLFCQEQSPSFQQPLRGLPFLVNSTAQPSHFFISFQLWSLNQASKPITENLFRTKWWRRASNNFSPKDLHFNKRPKAQGKIQNSLGTREQFGKNAVRKLLSGPLRSRLTFPPVCYFLSLGNIQKQVRSMNQRNNNY